MKSISANIIYNEAVKSGYKIEILSDNLDIFIVKKNKKNILFKNIDCGINTSLGMRFARYKNLTYFMLSKYKIKVPNSILIKGLSPNTKELIRTNNLSYPLVVKPSVGEHGDGVSVNIKDYEELKKAVGIALKFNDEVLIQEFFKGFDYRIVCINHKLTAAMQRVPAYVIGDGKNNIENLIKIENKKEIRGIGHEKSLSKIPLDKELKRQLEIQGFALSSIPKKGQKLFVRKNANLSTGGVSVDITDKIHPEIRKMCEKASKILGLKVCGIDYLSEDISKPLKDQKGGIIEVNHTPGLRGHHFPFEGKPRNVARAILKTAFN